MEKVIKRSIIIVSIIIVIVLFLIIAIKIKGSIEQKEERKEIEIAEQVKIEDVEKEERIYVYLNTNDILNKIFDYISEKDKENNNAETLINILDNEYKIEKNITEQNVLKFFSNYKNIDSYSTKEIYRKQISQRQNINGEYLYIKGIIRKNAEEEYIYILLKQDFINSTYNIRILTEEEFNNRLNSNNNKIFIQKNDYNSRYNNAINDYKICSTYLSDYIYTINNNPKNGYELLNEEYKNKRFKDVDSYVSYINNMKKELKDIILKEYSIENNGDSILYICKDQRGKHYIFEKKDMMYYTVILDTYTIDFSQFTEKYNKANDIEKVGYNIQRCIEAINNKDYTYVYNKLDINFRDNNYKTEEKFIEDIKGYLFNNNIIESASSTNEGKTYIYNITVIDAEDNKKKKDMTIIMQLKEGTDFVMSLSFN